MQYRDFGRRIDWKPSALGFGCMRLPTAGGPDDIDEAAATDMLRRAIDSGVNYLDTAWPYHGGNSERWLGRALAGGYRDRVKIATKLPTWEITQAADFDRFFDEQRTRLGVDCIDCYLVHTVQDAFWPPVRDLGVCDWLLKQRDRGRIGHAGFSFHGQLPLFCEVIDCFDEWDFCQVQYNYLTETIQAGTAGVEYAASKGLGVVVMEPLLGGCLANPPEAIRQVLASADRDVDPVALALDWLWDKPEISVVLSGMSTLSQVQHNVSLANDAAIGKLGRDDFALVARAREAYAALGTVPCTKCRYCMPCPAGVDIPVNVEYFNNAIAFGDGNLELNRNLYQFMDEEQRAGSCTACGGCEDACPQDIRISEWMPVIHDRLKKE